MTTVHAVEIDSEAITGDPEHHIMVYLAEPPNVVGVIHYDGDGCIQMIYVHPDHRREGIAKALCRAVEEPLSHDGHLTTDGAALVNALNIPTAPNCVMEGLESGEENGKYLLGIATDAFHSQSRSNKEHS